MIRHSRELFSAERGALHFFAIIVLCVSIAQIIYLRHLLDELNSSREELSLARTRIEELEGRLGKVERSNLREQVQQLGR